MRKQSVEKEIGPPFPYLWTPKEIPIRTIRLRINRTSIDSIYLFVYVIILLDSTDINYAKFSKYTILMTLERSVYGIIYHVFELIKF